MKTIPFFQSDCIYVAASFASANTYFFKDEKEVEFLHSKIRTYLQGMIDIVDLRCYPGGWILLFKTKSAHKIKSSYVRMKKGNLRYEDVGHILSEQFRLANSMTIRDCNFACKRSGSRVHSKLVKLIFESGEEYRMFLRKIEDIKVFTNQVLIEYFPEIGKVAEECGIRMREIRKNRNKKSYRKKVRKVRMFYGRMSECFWNISESIKLQKSQFYRSFELQVALIHITNTKNKHKSLFQPRFSIFGIP